MATLIPSLNSCLSKMQNGEKRLARRLEEYLEDDYLCWYEIPVGLRGQRYSDFIILHPGRGILLLEVKDWKIENVQTMDKQSVTLIGSQGLKIVSNPMEQVRQCAYKLSKQLTSDAQLLQADGRYKGCLIFPYTYGVVFSNITRKQFDQAELCHVIPSNRVICKDEMMEKIDPEEFQTRLWQMFELTFKCQLTLPQIDRIRWHLFPEIRIDAQPDLLDKETDADKKPISLLPDIVRVMDMQQEQLARSMGDGHRVIHGVAGSGKTMILGYRCQYLARATNKPIAVMCFNIALAAQLREFMEQKGIADRVNVYHFHDWCGEMLRTYHINKPEAGINYHQKQVDAVIAAVDKNLIPRGQYGALLIDEGHDFQPEWLKLVVQMVDPESNSLLLLYDDAQSIYKRQRAVDFTLSSVGIQARGRTTILKINYRNTNEILNFAYDFAQAYIAPEEQDDDHIPLIKPEAAGRSGPVPVIKGFDRLQDEVRGMVSTIQRFYKEEISLSSIAVIYHANWIGDEVAEQLSHAKIPFQHLNNASNKRNLRRSENSVKLLTMHSSKGLEFPIVMLPGMGYLPNQHHSKAEQAKLLYVAMTRATEKLLLTYHQPSVFVDRLLSVSSSVAIS